MTFSELKQLFRVDHDSTLATFYNENRAGFLAWAKRRYSVDEATLLDVYQDSIIVLYNMVLENKIENQNIKPQAYLFGIARNLALKKMNQVTHKSLDHVHDVKSDITDDYMRSFIEKTHTNKVLSDAIDQLKGNCKEILELFYYRQYKLDAICTALNLSNTDVVKSRKYQCLKKLKKIIGSKHNII